MLIERLPPVRAHVALSPLPPEASADTTARGAERILSALRLASTPQLGLQAALDALRIATGAPTALLASDSMLDSIGDVAAMGAWRVTHRSMRSSDTLTALQTPIPTFGGQPLSLLGSEPPDEGCFTWNGMRCFWVSVRARMLGRIGLFLYSEPNGPIPNIAAGRMGLAMMAAMLELDGLHRHILDQIPCDPMTHFLNARGFREEATRRFARLDWQTLPATVLVVHCRGLATIMEGADPVESADIMQQTADLLRRSARPTDVFGRLGSEHFAILMDGCDRFAAAERAERMTIHGLPLVSEAVRRLSVQIGLLEREPNSTATIEDLLTGAETALRRAHYEEKSWVFAAEAS